MKPLGLILNTWFWEYFVIKVDNRIFCSMMVVSFDKEHKTLNVYSIRLDDNYGVITDIFVKEASVPKRIEGT